MLAKGVIKIILISTLIFSVSACMYLAHPHAPNGWKKDSDLVDVSEVEDKPDQALLQVLVLSGSLNCSHTALRLYCFTKGALFWDSAGGYGRDEAHIPISRRYDLLANEGITTEHDSFFQTSLFGIYHNLPVSEFIEEQAHGFFGVRKTFFLTIYYPSFIGLVPTRYIL